MVKGYWAVGSLALGIGAMCVTFGRADGAPATAPSTAASRPATRPASAELLRKVQEQLLTVKTVEADFEQDKKLAMFDHTVKISGHFAVEKPNRLVWIVKKPVRYAVRIEGSEIRQWDQDTNKVQVIELGKDPVFKAVSEQIQAWFLGDYKVLSKTFEVELLQEKPLVLRFVPKADSVAAKMIQQIEMTFGKDERYIEGMEVEEVGGDVTTLKFLSPELNKPVKPETWEIPPRE